MTRCRTNARPKLVIALVVFVCLIVSGAAARTGGSTAGAAGSVVDVFPGESLSNAMRSAAPGDTIVLRNGVHPPQNVADVRPSGRITVRGESRTGTVVQGLNLVNVANVSLSDLTATGFSHADANSAIRLSRSADIDISRVTARPLAQSGVDITSGTTRVTVTDSVIDGSAVTDSERGRGIRIYAGSGSDRATWVSHVTITGNEIFGAAGDLIQAYGATDVVIADNILRDPQVNSAHNDGVQLLWTERVVIDSNWFSASGPTGPDQAMMIEPAASGHSVVDTTIVNNLVVRWPGSGLIVGRTTNTVVANNTIVPHDPEDTSWIQASMIVSAPNTQLQVFNNVLTRLDVMAGATPTLEDHNCMRFGGSGAHNVSAPPRFADFVSLRLAADSPCLRIGAVRSGAPGADRVDTPRGPSPDPGAWQWTGAVLPTPTTTTTAPPSLTVADVSNTEAAGALTFTLRLSAPSSEWVSVRYATRPGTATGGWADFSDRDDSAAFAPGETAVTVRVPLKDDAVWEPDERFTLTLSGLTGGGATMGRATATGTIVNDDRVPAISIAGTTVIEGSSSNPSLRFAVTLTNPSSTAVSVQYATVAGTAVAPSDFSSRSGTVTFAPGQVSQPVIVYVIADTTPEADETMQVRLSGATGATVATVSATGTIVDDDGAPAAPLPTPRTASGPAVPVLDVADVTTSEASEWLTFRLSLSTPSSEWVSVRYATVAGTARGGWTDYSDRSGTAAFRPGTTVVTMRVPLKRDSVWEPEEQFSLRLSGASGGGVVLGRTTATATIVDDDRVPAITITDASVGEGSSTSPSMRFTVNLSNPSSEKVTVQYATAAGTARTPSDFTSRTGTVTFWPGQLSQPVYVYVYADRLDEPNEHFEVRLSAASGGTISRGVAVGTILDDD